MKQRFFFEVGKREDYMIILDDGSKFFVAGHPDATWMFIYAPNNANVGTVLFLYKSLGTLIKRIADAGIIEKLEDSGFVNIGKFKGIATKKQNEDAMKGMRLWLEQVKDTKTAKV